MFLALTAVVIDPDGTHELRQGALFSLPAELTDTYRVKKYASLRGTGWIVSEFGYMALVRESRIGKKYILPGLYLMDGPLPSKRIPGYKPLFAKRQIEDYLDKYISWETSVFKEYESELTALVHDLRHLSGSIYHSAIDAENSLKLSDISRAREGVKTVIAAQTMLRVRIDYLDFSNSIDRFDDVEDIPVFSRVDKVVRCFKAAARHKGVEINLEGESYRLARGPNVLDIVPYALIDNAIKYAPRNTGIVVSVNDDNESTEVSVTSIGPFLDPNETQKIFEKGYRGENARVVRTSGTGLGLSVAKSVVDLFSGQVFVSQVSEHHDRGDISYARISFKFSIPTGGEDSHRRKKFERLQSKRLKLPIGRSLG